MVLDDGATFIVDSTYVIGREPQRHQEVMVGSARPLRLDDTDRLVSRIHAILRLDGWNVTVTDLDSENGTEIRPEGGLPSVSLVPNEPHVLQSGSRIWIGPQHAVRVASPALTAGRQGSASPDPGYSLSCS